MKLHLSCVIGKLKRLPTKKKNSQKFDWICFFFSALSFLVPYMKSQIDSDSIGQMCNTLMEFYYAAVFHEDKI